MTGEKVCWEKLVVIITVSGTQWMAIDNCDVLHRIYWHRASETRPPSIQMFLATVPSIADCILSINGEHKRRHQRGHMRFIDVRTGKIRCRYLE